MLTVFISCKCLIACLIWSLFSCQVAPPMPKVSSKVVILIWYHYRKFLTLEYNHEVNLWVRPKHIVCSCLAHWFKMEAYIQRTMIHHGPPQSCPHPISVNCLPHFHWIVPKKCQVKLSGHKPMLNKRSGANFMMSMHDNTQDQSEWWIRNNGFIYLNAYRVCVSFRATHLHPYRICTCLRVALKLLVIWYRVPSISPAPLLRIF